MQIRIERPARPAIANALERVHLNDAEEGGVELRPIDLHRVEERHILRADHGVVHSVGRDVIECFQRQQKLAGEWREVPRALRQMQRQR